MGRPATGGRRRFGAWRAWALAGLALCAAAGKAGAQTTDEEEAKLKMLTEPSAREKAEKARKRPPFEVFRSQVAPFDVLPFVKANHWATISLELRSNHADYAGQLQTGPVPLAGLPVSMAYRRDARLVKEQSSRLSLQALLPEIPRDLGLELSRPESIRADESWPAPMRVLEPSQMLVVILSGRAGEDYSRWNRFRAMVPTTIDLENAANLEANRYYRLVQPLDREKPLLSPHPLTWTPISHLIWEDLPPEALSPAQQQAMLDWLHWGGQVVLVGGAGTTFSALRDSFLAPYLPADPTGQNALLAEADLQPLAESYRPLAKQQDDPNDPEAQPLSQAEWQARYGTRYRPPEPIRPASNRPVYLAGLQPRPGATSLRIGGRADRVLGVEHRVGRGRILMLALNPADPALAAWPGLDTFIRRVILRRAEEIRGPDAMATARLDAGVRYGRLGGADLSWVRLIGRDLISPTSKPAKKAASPNARPTGASTVVTTPTPTPATKVARKAASPAVAEEEAPAQAPADDRMPPPDYAPANRPIAEWVDTVGFPRLCRHVLENASGISIPGSGFVLKVVLAYVLSVIPLNWLLCRFVLGRREWAWVFVPILSLGFAVAVERAAAYDLGYDSACDEVDLVELHGGYGRAHVSRFASIYTTGRVKYEVSYASSSSALALPLDNGRSLRGEEVTQSSWQSNPVPTLGDLRVQPRSLAMFRAEQVVDLPGPVALVTDDAGRRVVNNSDFELRDAVLAEAGSPPRLLGTIAPGASLDLGSAGDRRPVDVVAESSIDPNPLLKALLASFEDRPEDRGELRLVAWSPTALPGQRIEPEVDRRRGLTLVVAHLRYGPPPDPDTPRYNTLASAGSPAATPVALTVAAPAGVASPGR